MYSRCRHSASRLASASRLVWGLGWFLLVSGFASDLAASQPRLNLILPRGVQRGTEQKLRFMGERINETQEVLLYDSGIAVVKIEPVDANTIDVTVNVAAECRLGEHVVQVRTLRGISEFRSVYVGALPQIDELEPNTTLDAPQAISGNVTIQGTVTNEDVDYFVLEAKAGERISVEVEAVRLGCPLGTIFDPFVAVLNAERFELAVCDDSSLFNQDGFVSVVAPTDGKYTVMVRESSYGGNDACRYRLHIGNFPRPTAVYPAGGAAGEAAELTFLGDPTGPIKQTLTLPAANRFRPTLFLQTETGITPSPLPFRLSNLPNALEVEPNQSWPTEPVLELPQALNGIIQEAGDQDFFLINAKKDQVWEVECFARRIGSGLDPVLHIFKAADKSTIAGNDDSRGHDAYLRFQVPEDGQYYLRVMDHLQRGKADFVYRLEVTPVTPVLRLSIPRVDRYSQDLQTISIPAGNRFATQLVASRENFGGEVELLQASLPPGIKMTAPKMLANLNTIPVMFEADPAATPVGALVDLRARLVSDTQQLEGGFFNLADFANGEPNNTLYYGCEVNRLAMAVTKPAPFRVEIVTPRAPLVRDGTLNVKVRIIREPGFEEPVNLQFPFRPPGVGTTNQITAAKDQVEIDYPLNANGNAQLGTWPVYVLAGAAVEGGTCWVSSQLADVVVAEPFVRITAARTACDQGQTAQVICTLEQVAAFEGEATVNLVGLPPNTATAPLKFTKESTEIVFQVTTNEQSPIGQHKGLLCQVVIPVKDDSAALSTGATELTINKPVVAAAPPPTPPPAAAAAPAEPAPPPAAKPLTRLEQLRQRAKGSGGSGEER
ncbi:MAG: PPC domain-containing protein [Planctomycetota bacterium]